MHFEFEFAPQNVTISGSGWMGPVSKLATVSSALSFSSGSADLSTANLAVMVMGGTGTNVTLEFRWAWTENSSGTTTVGSWSTPSSTATTPSYPSIFIAAPYVRRERDEQHHRGRWLVLLPRPLG